ncbi:MAG: shikimate dehydrogenase [Gammaproteobacteria bacterium]|nr:MAG: shikimate dehydrogenase [Gammaproteobacteria bacterium]
MDQYCVFGNPIEHSRSPFIHQQFAQQTQQKLNYEKKFVELKGFPQAVKTFIAQGGKGANVTVPFKEQALQLCDHLSESAKQAGAVNTLSFIKGEIYGDNTDGIGLVQDLLRYNISLAKSRILLLGAGGAAKGVLLPLLAENPANIVIANRTVSKAEQLCMQFTDKRLQSCGFDKIPQQPFNLIINATSASLSGTFPAISPQLICEYTVCYDMVYGKELTSFLQWARIQGAEKVIDGLGMLVGQAAISFNIWRNVTPDTETVIEALKADLAVA